MVKFLIIFLSLSFKTAFGEVNFTENPDSDYLIPCDPPPLLSQTDQTLGLLQAIKPIVGNIPRFCRDFASPGDDKNDEILNEQVKSLILRDKDKDKDKLKDKYKFQVPSTKNTALEIFQMVAMKKLWSTMSEPARIKTFLHAPCDFFGLNKWPVLKKYKSPKATEEEDQVKQKDMNKLCEFYQGEVMQEGALKSLSKYLTKDVITEAFAILRELKDVNFVEVKDFTCTVFEKVDETIFQDNVYSGYVLSNKEVSNKEDFRKWLLGLNQEKLEVAIEDYGDDLKIKVLQFFQKLKRTKPINKIISEDEQESLYHYVGSGYGPMNECLRTENCPYNIKQNIDLLKSALAKLKKERGTDEEQILFRGARGLPKFVIENLEKGARAGTPTMIDKAFISTSGKASVAMGFGNVESYDDLSDKKIVFVIKAKSCVGVDNFAEDEFICPPGTKFRVKKLKESGLYQMDEVN